MSANDKQVAGNHYGLSAYQHWDIVVQFQLNYYEGQITKYVMRCRSKNGKQDLEKAKHFIEKYLEVYDKLALPTEVVRVLPMPPSKEQLDLTYEEQLAAEKHFHADGFVSNGTQYQCIYCRQTVLSGSPLTALITHRPLCPSWPAPAVPERV